MPQPSVAIPKCKLFILCLLSASIQAIQQPKGLKFTLWGDLCLSSKGKCFFSWRRWYYMTYLSSHSYMVQLRLGADEKIKRTPFKQLAHSKSLCDCVQRQKTNCKLVLEHSMGSFHYNFSSKLSALQQL